MTDLIFITSIIDIPNKPLSYTKVRSIYTAKERFQQTKRTIESIKSYMRMGERRMKIMIIECSNFRKGMEEREMEKYLIDNTDYYINLWDRVELHENIFGISKTLGEMTLTKEVIEYIRINGLKFENIYKISGRYEILNKIDMDKYWNRMNIFYYYKEHNIVSTVFYKIRYENIEEFYEFIVDSLELCRRCVGLEVIFMNYIKKLINKGINNIYLLTEGLDVTGNIAVDGNKLV
jgi:hypothetical protein